MLKIARNSRFYRQYATTFLALVLILILAIFFTFPTQAKATETLNSDDFKKQDSIKLNKLESKNHENSSNEDTNDSNNPNNNKNPVKLIDDDSIGDNILDFPNITIDDTLLGIWGAYGGVDEHTILLLKGDRYSTNCYGYFDIVCKYEFKNSQVLIYSKSNVKNEISIPYFGTVDTSAEPSGFEKFLNGTLNFAKNMFTYIVESNSLLSSFKNIIYKPVLKSKDFFYLDTYTKLFTNIITGADRMGSITVNTGESFFAKQLVKSIKSINKFFNDDSFINILLDTSQSIYSKFAVNFVNSIIHNDFYTYYDSINIFDKAVQKPNNSYKFNDNEKMTIKGIPDQNKRNLDLKDYNLDKDLLDAYSMNGLNSDSRTVMFIVNDPKLPGNKKLIFTIGGFRPTPANDPSDLFSDMYMFNTGFLSAGYDSDKFVVPYYNSQIMSLKMFSTMGLLSGKPVGYFKNSSTNDLYIGPKAAALFITNSAELIADKLKTDQIDIKNFSCIAHSFGVYQCALVPSVLDKGKADSIIMLDPARDYDGITFDLDGRKSGIQSIYEVNAKIKESYSKTVIVQGLNSCSTDKKFAKDIQLKIVVDDGTTNYKEGTYKDMTSDCFGGATEHSTPQTAYDSIFKYNLNAPLKNGGNALDISSPLETAAKLNSNGVIKYNESATTSATSHDVVWLLKETSKLEVDNNPLKVTNYKTTEEVKSVMYSNYKASTLKQVQDGSQKEETLEGYLQDARCKNSYNNMVIQGTNKDNVVSSYAAVTNNKPNGCDEVRGDGGNDTMVSVGNLPQKLVGESGDDIFDLRNVKDYYGFTYIEDFGDGGDKLRLSKDDNDKGYYRPGPPGHGYDNGVGFYRKGVLIAVVDGENAETLITDMSEKEPKFVIFK